MKKQELQKAIRKLKKVSPKKSSLPILDNVLNDNGTLTCSDLSVTYTLNIGFEGKFLINLRQLDKILSKLPAGSEIDIKNNGEKVDLILENGAKFSLSAQDVEDFPKTIECNDPIGKLIEENIKTIKKAVKFIASDELRPVMMNVFISEHIAASDAHRLVYYKYERKLSEDILIGDNVIECMNEASYEVFVGKKVSDNRMIKFVNENETIIFRECEGKFPTYQAVIPETNTFEYSMNTKELRETVNLALIATNQATHLIKFSFKKDSLNVSSEDVDFDRSFNHSISCKKDKGSNEGIEIGMKGSFLIDLLADCEETITLKMEGPTRAILIDDNKLLMPMMLTD